MVFVSCTVLLVMFLHITGCFHIILIGAFNAIPHSNEVGSILFWVTQEPVSIDTFNLPVDALLERQAVI
ncbi:hypothetical protein BDV59DRAFT_169656 [Aspergillus ambiguus]|uniref:uncharacterized protein n=1 Tax=Aspergillus ambiguus TaxID=176160 RepID=UPI003CCD3DFD